MANHGYVITKKPMTPERVTEVLETLNKRVFKGMMKIEYSNCVGDDSAWGDHVWLVTQGEYVRRVCWLNSKRSFELRHGGDDFEWWWDNAVTNEIACEFNGTVGDDACEGKTPGVPGEYDDPKEYCLRLIPYAVKDRITSEELNNRLKMRFETFPDEFIPAEFK
jgi:hypothetical protein